MNDFKKRSLAKIAEYWLPVVAWAALIFFFSTEQFSAPQTSRILVPLLHWVYPDISPEQIALVQFAVRKLAHWIEYFVLAALLYRALQFHSSVNRSLPRVALTMALVLLCAASDEFHQSLLSDRTGSIYDVMIDGFGGLFGTLWMYQRGK